MKKFLMSAIFTLLIIPVTSYGMSSPNYNIPSLKENHGSGFRSSTNYQIISDAISIHPIGISTSTNYTLTGQAIVPLNFTQPSGGVYINSDDAYTNSISVTLSLICGDPSGCDEVTISNNSVSWSTPEPYSTYKSWNLIANEGERKVFVKYKNGLDVWSGVFSDSIILDTSGPSTTISPEGGVFMSPPAVTITSSEPGTIYYTTDGLVPTDNSPIYTSPIVISTNTTLQCFSEDVAGNQGPVATEEYTVCGGTNLSISGVVIDVTVDKGVPLAIITLDSGHSATTDLNGNYVFPSLSRGYYRIESITTATPGYATYQKELLLCEDNIVHDINLTKLNTVFGSNTFSGYSVDSVNTSTGNYTYEETDLAIPGKGLSFSFDRAYNSLDETNGPLGYGWTHNYNITLSEGVDGEVTIHWGDGKAETWIPDGIGGYTPMYGVFDALIKNPDNSFTIKKKDLIQYKFNTANKLTVIEDENGNALTFSYNGNNIDSIVDTSGRTISFLHDASNRITRILDPMSRSVTFTYDVNGDLVSSTDLNGNTTTYSYNSNHQVLQITDPLDNDFVTIVYDEQRRVVASQRDALGAETIYSYDAVNKVTQIVDPLGNISYHHFDDLLRLTQEQDARGNSAYYTYDERGNISSVKDKNENVTSYTYDDNGNVLVKTDPLGGQSSATYDANNNPLTKTDFNGNTTTFTYDVKANLETVTDPLGNTTSYTYDSFGQMLTVTNALGFVTTKEYDIYGNLVKVTDALGNQSTFTYDIVGRKLTENHPLGRATAYEYDDKDHLVSVTDALGGITTFTYDANGNKTEHLDALDNAIAFSYDAKNHLVSKTTPLNETEYYTYDLLDRRKAITNHKGATASLSFDAVGNIIRETDALQNQIQHAYDPNGNRIATTDARGNTTTFSYDVLNRLVLTIDPLGNTKNYTYDANGNRLAVTDSLGNMVQYSYDAMNRLQSVTDPLGNVTTSEYDALGNLIRVTDAKGNQTVFEYDALNRKIRVTDAASGEVTATYDALGNRTSLTDTRGNSTTYTYDELNRLVSEIDPLGNTKLMEYDAVGNLISLTDANGETTYSYDLNYRLTTVTYPDITTVSYTYDQNGNRLSIIDSLGTTSYVYNVLDQITSATDPFGLTVSYTYDPNGNRISIRYPGFKTVFYTYDPLNRLIYVQDWGGIITEYQYDSVSRLISKTMGNGSTVLYTYDNASRLVGKEDRNAADSLIASYTYTLDQVGNRTSMDMDQPLIPTVNVVDHAFAHDNANRVLSQNSTTFTHDDKGNRTARDDGSVTTQYTYNYDDLLTQVSNGSNIDNYLYNGDGIRLASIENGFETRYLLDITGDMEFVLAEMDASNTFNTYYIYGDGLLYSIDATTGERLFYHYDPTGNTVAITNLAGTVTDKYAYLPFGELTNTQTTHDNPFTFVGKYGVMQESNGLYFMRARFYDPETKRFLSKDSVEGSMDNSQRLSPYVYVSDNPLVNIDPDGRFFLALDIGVCGTQTPYIGPSHQLPYKPVPQLPYHGPNPSPTYHPGPWTNWLTKAAQIMQHLHTLSEEDRKLGSYFMGEEEQTVYAFAGPVEGNPIVLETEKTLKQADDTFTSKVKTDLDVRGYAQGFFSKEFSKLRDPDLFNEQTRSQIEWAIELELRSLQQKRYWYWSEKRAQRVKAEMMGDVAQSAKRLYARLADELSKYSVLIEDLDKLPEFNSGNLNRRGVYASK